MSLENQLLVLEPNIGEQKGFCDKNEYEINDLQVRDDHYEYTSQFYVVTMLDKEVDTILNRPWFKELVTFMLNTKTKTKKS